MKDEKEKRPSSQNREKTRTESSTHSRRRAEGETDTTHKKNRPQGEPKKRRPRPAESAGESAAPAERDRKPVRKRPAAENEAAEKHPAVRKQRRAAAVNSSEQVSKKRKPVNPEELEDITPEPVKKKSAGRKFAEVMIALLLIGGLGTAVGYPLITGMLSVDHMSNEEPLGVVQETDENGEIVTEPVTEAVTEPVFDTKTMAHSDIYKGSLMLVNYEYEFRDTDADIVKLFEEKSDLYSVSGMEVSVQSELIPHLNDMLNQFYYDTGHSDILIVDGYRTRESQQQLYDDDLEMNGIEESTRVALPGHSEHETGYAMDFSLYFDDGTAGEYDGTGDYEWMDKNCADYGFILRYPEHKEDITKIQFESWHYRYVGIPHAYYIMQNKLCLEEYIELLHSCTKEAPLEIVDGTGDVYEVYFVQADPDEKLMTFVPVPQDKSYTISGNNYDGFIVTVNTGEKRELPAETAPEETTPVTEEGVPATEETTEDSAEATEEIIAVG